MLKLSSTRDHDRTRVALEGQIVGPWAGELRRVCEQAEEDGLAVTVDLFGVTFVDRQAVLLCRGLRSRGIEFVNGSSFVLEQLKGDQP
jgi:hypothetical protein